jgi:hypothetical protein
MIKRKTTKVLAELYEDKFTRRQSGGYYTAADPPEILKNEFYDFLYENDYPAWFCNQVKQFPFARKRCIKDWIMRLHTGETVLQATPDWTWEQREKLGQRYLRDLAENLLNFYEQHGFISDFYKKYNEKLQKSLELDGYIYRNSILLTPESDILDVNEEEGVLTTLYKSLGLANQQTAFHHLELSEKHYVDGKWDDSISNSRKFLECVLEEVASKHNVTIKGAALPSAITGKPLEVRNYLEREDLLESKEKEALAKVYGLLSATGGHPYMAQNDQARLLRHLALTFCQFAMLRLDGKLKSNP